MSKISLICYYLSCGYCCLNATYYKKEMKKKKFQNLETLDQITTESHSESDLIWAVTKNPMDIKTQEMTDLFCVPNKKFKTESDVFTHLGFKIERFLEKGGFGTVYKGVHLERGFPIAIKTIIIPEPIGKAMKFKRKDLLKDVKNELFALQKLRHPHVIRLIRHFMIRDHNRLSLNILMQFAEGGNLLKKCQISGPFDERKCKVWFAQILDGLSYMHMKGIAHRDLKCDNILLDVAQDVLISDFGLSRLVWRQSEEEVLLSQTFCGTPPYMAPEVLILEKKGYLKYNAFSADVWALGVILFRMYDNSYPFPRKANKAIKNMKKKKWRFSNDRNPSKELKDLFKKIFEFQAKKRPNVHNIQKIVWIKDVFKEIQTKSLQKMKDIQKTDI